MPLSKIFDSKYYSQGPIGVSLFVLFGVLKSPTYSTLVLVISVDPENPEITQTNVSISNAVQKFIFETKRFSQ